MTAQRWLAIQRSARRAASTTTAMAGQTTLTTARMNLVIRPSAARTPAPTWTATAGPMLTMPSPKTQPRGRTLTATATATTTKGLHPMTAQRWQAPLRSTALAVWTRTAMAIPTPTACGMQSPVRTLSSTMLPSGPTLTGTATATTTPTTRGRIETLHGQASTEPTWSFKTLARHRGDLVATD